MDVECCGYINAYGFRTIGGGMSAETCYDEAREIWNSMSPSARKILAMWLNMAYSEILCQQRQQKGNCRMVKYDNTFDSSGDIVVTNP